MKTLNEMAIMPLDEKELKEINGGVFGLDDFLIGVAIGATLAIIDDWDNFKRGIAGRPEVAK